MEEKFKSLAESAAKTLATQMGQRWAEGKNYQAVAVIARDMSVVESQLSLIGPLKDVMSLPGIVDAARDFAHKHDGVVLAVCVGMIDDYAGSDPHVVSQLIDGEIEVKDLKPDEIGSALTTYGMALDEGVFRHALTVKDIIRKMPNGDEVAGNRRLFRINHDQEA